MTEFIGGMYQFVPREARVMFCQFPGDPNNDMPGKWVARTLTRVNQLSDDANVYLAVSAMKQNERGEYRRRKENFAGGILLMIDDLGHGSGSKFAMSLIQCLRPTALIETSPDNHQAIYMFDSLVTDAALFDALINGFIAKQFLGKDTGMTGINRVFRPPFGINGKPKYGGFKVRCVEWNPAARYSVADIVKAFAIDLASEQRSRVPHHATTGKSDSIRAFIGVRQALRDAGMLKREEADLSGWQDITCPWVGEHTDSADNGAAIREPAEENDYIGAFRCHHGSHEGRGWRELTEWLSENQEIVLANVNQKAGVFGQWKNVSNR